MWIVDANVLLYAVNTESVHHVASRGWLDRSLGGSVPVALSWPTLLTFLRVSTHPAAFAEPLSVDVAVAQARAWLEAPAAVTIEPTARHLDVLAGLLAEAGTAGNLVPDAHLAALAAEHAATIVSFDRDFARFAGVRWQAPG